MTCLPEPWHSRLSGCFEVHCNASAQFLRKAVGAKGLRSCWLLMCVVSVPLSAGYSAGTVFGASEPLCDGRLA